MADCTQCISENRLNRCQIFRRFGFKLNPNRISVFHASKHCDHDVILYTSTKTLMVTINIRIMPGGTKLTHTLRHRTQATEQEAVMLLLINTSTNTSRFWYGTQCKLLEVVRYETMSCWRATHSQGDKQTYTAQPLLPEIVQSVHTTTARFIWLVSLVGLRKLNK